MAAFALSRAFCLVFFLLLPSEEAVRTESHRANRHTLAESGAVKHADVMQAEGTQDLADATGGCYYKREGARCTATINTIIGKELTAGTCQCVGERYSFKEAFRLKHYSIWHLCKDSKLKCKPRRGLFGR